MSYIQEIGVFVLVVFAIYNLYQVLFNSLSNNSCGTSCGSSCSSDLKKSEFKLKISKLSENK